MICHIEAVDSEESTGAPDETEIEITPKMIRAAGDVIWGAYLIDVPHSVAEEIGADALRAALKVHHAENA